jgi:hypothetical protein
VKPLKTEVHTIQGKFKAPSGEFLVVSFPSLEPLEFNDLPSFVKDVSYPVIGPTIPSMFLDKMLKDDEDYHDQL